MQVDTMPRANAWDLADILDPELYISPSSRESTPMAQHLPTPPQQTPYPSFPTSDPSSDSFFAFLDSADDSKAADPYIDAAGLDFPYDFTMMMTSPGPSQGSADYSMDMLMNMGGMGAMDMGIDPQLVDSPAPQEEEEEAMPRSKKRDLEVSTRSSKRVRNAKPAPPPAPTPAHTPSPPQLTIAPVKVGGRGGARRGTVQGGGINKKSAVAPVNGALGVANVAVYGGSVFKEDKENEEILKAKKPMAEALPSPPSSHHGEEEEEQTSSWGFSRPPAPAPVGSILTGNALVANGRKVTPFDLGIEGLSLSASFAIPPGTFNVTTPSAVGSSSGLGVGALIGAANAAAGRREESVDADGDGDEIPADWRPSAETLAKMTSKEKRQLRNKISARNFRVRRKEYISTLELDIAERDRLLDAIRSELGTSRNENVALRQEIEALKRTLLDGRAVPAVDLPPPAPLPERSAAETLAVQQQQQQALVSSSNLLKPNTQKDRNGNSKFWGGVGGLGGVLPVHTAFVPSVASGFASMRVAGLGLQENMNPLMRGRPVEEEEERKDSFEGFADANMFTMKSMDAYRMHLWGKMAAQYHLHQQQQAQQQAHHRQQPSGLAANLRPSYFTSVSAGALSGKAAVESRGPLSNATNGVHTPLLAAFLSGKQMSLFGKHEKQEERKVVQEQEQQTQAAVLAAVASQTILRKLGQAFWDAFSGGSSSHSNAWDADKVRRVLDGSAEVRIVDVEPAGGKVKVKEVAARINRNVSAGGSVSVPSSPVIRAATAGNEGSVVKRCDGGVIGRALAARREHHQVEKGVCDVLEERMRGLALGAGVIPAASAVVAGGGVGASLTRRTEVS